MRKKSFYAFDRKPYNLKVNTIKNCIFACDIEPSAVDIAKLRLWLSIVIDDEITDEPGNGEFDERTKPRQLPNLDCNIICGNSLIDEFKGMPLLSESDLLHNVSIDSQMTMHQGGFDSLLSELIKLQDKLFFVKDHNEKEEIKDDIQDIYNRIIIEQLEGNKEAQEAYYEAIQEPSSPFIIWQLYFPQVFRDNGGFDIVIGNPPYKLCQPSNSEDEDLVYFKKHFQVASYKIDLFHLFFEIGIRLIKEGGVLSYITPNTYLTNKYIKPLRKYILDSCSIHKIVNHDKVFDAASVDTATIILTKEKIDDNTITVLRSSDFSFSEVCRKKQDDWEQDKDYIFNINEEDIIELDNCVKLGDICKTYFGIQAFDRKASISDQKETVNYLPCIDGGDIHPYSYAIPKIYFNYLPENIKSGGDWNVYVRERIVVRQIGQIPVVGMCNGGILGSNTMYSIYPKGDKYDLRFLFACLNSSVIKDYWKAKYSDNKALFPKIKGFQLKELPIPDVNKEKQKTIVELVNQILEMKEKNSDGNIGEIEKEIDSRVRELYGVFS